MAKVRQKAIRQKKYLKSFTERWKKKSPDLFRGTFMGFLTFHFLLSPLYLGTNTVKSVIKRFLK
jgi:hypothetical protein